MPGRVIKPRARERKGRSSKAAPTASGPDTAAVRARILGAARRTFFQFGFARFTMDDLANELGMSKKTLYQNFRSKEALVDALVTIKLGGAVAGFEAILDARAEPFAARAHRAMQHMLRELAEISPVFLRDLQRLTPGIYARLEELRRTNIPRLWSRLLEDGIAAGAVCREVDVSFASQFFMLSIQALLRPENLDLMRRTPSQAVAGVFDVTFGDLLTPRGRKDYEKNRARAG